MSKYIDAVGQAYKEIQEKKLIDLQADVNGGIKLDTETAVQEKLMTSAERAKAIQKKADAAKKKAMGQAKKTGYKFDEEDQMCEACGKVHAEGACSMKNEAKMDPVDKDELKGKHKDRKDKDIDNDGDVDDTDTYLHKRRKAISKSKDKEGDIKANPKMDDEMGKSEQKESRIRTALKAVLAEKSQTAGATPPETMDDKLKGKGAKDMVNQPTEKDDTEEKGHDDASKAGRVTKPAAARNGGDNVRSGDQKIVNKVKEAYASMYKEESDD